MYFYGIKNGGLREWDFAFEQFQKTTVASERRKILYGLSGAREPWILSRYKAQFGVIKCLRQSIISMETMSKKNKKINKYGINFARTRCHMRKLIPVCTARRTYRNFLKKGHWC